MSEVIFAPKNKRRDLEGDRAIGAHKTSKGRKEKDLSGPVSQQRSRIRHHRNKLNKVRHQEGEEMAFHATPLNKGA